MIEDLCTGLYNDCELPHDRQLSKILNMLFEGCEILKEAEDELDGK